MYRYNPESSLGNCPMPTAVYVFLSDLNSIELLLSSVLLHRPSPPPLHNVYKQIKKLC